MIDDIARHRVPALWASRLIKTIAATPVRAWLLHVGPSGLRIGAENFGGVICRHIPAPPDALAHKRLSSSAPLLAGADLTFGKESQRKLNECHSS